MYKRCYWFAIFVGWSYFCCGAQPLHNYSDKTLNDLRGLLRDNDYQKRNCAAYFIGVRYRNPNLVMVGGPLIRSNSPQPQLPIPPGVVEELSHLITSDDHIEVRISGLLALGRMRLYYDTTSILQGALTDTNAHIRLTAAGELIELHRDYMEPLAGNVVSTLVECIEKNQDPEVLWIAAFRLGCLGDEARGAVPALEKLREHGSQYVRRRASEALERIKLRNPAAPGKGDGEKP